MTKKLVLYLRNLFNNFKYRFIKGERLSKKEQMQIENYDIFMSDVATTMSFIALVRNTLKNKQLTENQKINNIRMRLLENDKRLGLDECVFYKLLQNDNI